jgi:glucose/arabinose dehydrogenase
MSNPRWSSLLLIAVAAAASACSGGGSSTPPADSCAGVPASALVTAWTADPHFCLVRFADGLTEARGLAVAPNGDIFVATSGGQVIALFDEDEDGVSGPAERSTFTTSGGNHGIALTATHLYVSSDTTVRRFTYSHGQRVAMGTPETIVAGLPGGGHGSRTLLIDAQDRLYVNIGSGGNVDAPADPNTPSSSRAVIRRYDLASIPAGGYPASGGELFAAGLRNEVGLTFDGSGRLWGVENGRDDLEVGGNDIHLDNPAEEVNLFDPARPGRNYGYPFCWSEGIWSGTGAGGPGTQHLDPDQPGGFSEARCQDASVVVPPAFAMRAHLAPLDIVEYRGSGYPGEYRGNLFVTSHGSWNRESMQVGRLIIRLRPRSGTITQADNFLGDVDATGGLREGAWQVRPVSIVVDGKGLLTFSDDSVGTVHKIGYRP